MKLSWYLRKKKLTLRNPIFRGKLLVSLASFIQESGWEFFRELATSIGGHSVFFLPKPLGSRMTLTIKVPGRRHTVGPYYKNPLKKWNWLIILLHSTVCQILNMKWMIGNGNYVNLLKLTWQHSWNYFCWTHFWWVLAIWNQCAARLGVDVHIFYMNTVLFSCTYVGQPHPHHYPGKRRALHRNSLHDPVKG